MKFWVLTKVTVHRRILRLLYRFKMENIIGPSEIISLYSFGSEVTLNLYRKYRTLYL